MGGGEGGWVGLGGGQGGCERRIEVFVKIQKKNRVGEGGGRGRVWGVRVDVIEELKSFWKIHTKKIRGGGSVWGGGIRVVVNEELKFLCKFKKKKYFFFFLGGGGSGGGSGWGSQDGCERRIEVFVKIQKKIGGGARGGQGGSGWGGQGGCE